jgi:restriction system protein
MGDGKEHPMNEVVEHLASEFKLTDEERRSLYPSGQQHTFNGRVSWARTYLKKAGLLESPKRSYIKITDRGLEILKQNPQVVDNKFLMQFQEFVVFRTLSKPEPAIGDTGNIKEHHNGGDPEEVLQASYTLLKNTLAQDILENLMNCSPTFFERLVVQLLVKMGYGGSIQDAGKAIGQSGDEGIDGLIKEDRLGLDTVYIQAKRWANVVSRPEIQKFAGALQGHHAHKGVFITTSSFSKEAEDFAKKIESRIALIDGNKLAEYMIDFDIGVSKVSTYDVKRIDSDYFIED